MKFSHVKIRTLLHKIDIKKLPSTYLETMLVIGCRDRYYQMQKHEADSQAHT